MIFEIPIDVSDAVADGEVAFDVELDGSTYNLRLSYADSSQLWYMSLFLQADTTPTPIVQGCALVSMLPLLLDVQVDDRPAGELIVIGPVDAGRSDLGSRCKLFYYDAEEIAAL